MKWKSLVWNSLKPLVGVVLVSTVFYFVVKSAKDGQEWRARNDTELFQLWTKNTGNPGGLTQSEWTRLRENKLLCCPPLQQK